MHEYRRLRGQGDQERGSHWEVLLGQHTRLAPKTVKTLVKNEGHVELGKKRRQLILATVSRLAMMMELRFIPLIFLLQVIPGNVNNMSSRERVSKIYYKVCGTEEKTEGWTGVVLQCAIKI